MAKQMNKCHLCGDHVDEDVNGINTEEGILCEGCWKDTQEECAICGDYFDNPNTPESTRFALTCDEGQYKAGIYQVLKFPFFYGSVTSGFDAFFEGSIRRVVDLPHGEIVDNWYICQLCFEKALDKALDKHGIGPLDLIS